MIEIEETTKRKDGSFIVLFKNDKRDEVFLVFRSDFPIWNLTGGGIEDNENPEETAIREAFEETGFRIKITRKIGCYQYRNKRTNEIINQSYLFEGRVVSGTFKPEFPKCKGQWFSIYILPKDLTSGNFQKIKDVVTFDGKEFNKTVYENYILNNLHLLFRHPISFLKFFWRRK